MRTKVCLGLLAILLYSYVLAETNGSYSLPRHNGTAVNDFANLINSEDTKKIKSLCEEIRKDELASIVIATVDSVPEGYENPVIYGTDLFNFWRIGRKGINDGILILISKNDRKTAICTGYLTEHYLPDAEAGNILRKYMIPNFKKGNYGLGIISGMIEARKVMEKNRRLMYPEKYGKIK